MSDQPAKSTAVSRYSAKPLARCETISDAFGTQEFRDRIDAAVPKHVQPDRMLRTFVQAASRTPLLMQCELRSFVGACLTLSQLGLEPNSPLGQGYLIPFKSKRRNPATGKWDIEVVECNLIIGYQGFLDLAYRSPLVKSIHCDIVWPGDDFSFEYGSDAHLRHKPTSRHDPSAPFLYGYMFANLQDGFAMEVMPYEQIMGIRNLSQGYRAAMAAKADAETKGYRVPATYTEAPWIKHMPAMARKTPMRSGAKWLPRSIELLSATHLDELSDTRRRMDFAAALDEGTIDGKVDYVGAVTQAAEEEDPAPGLRDEPARTHVQVNRPPPDEKPPQAQQTAQPVPGDVPVFEHFLVDQHGELVERDGTHDTFADPVEWARRYSELLGATETPEIRDTLAEHNADALADAVQHPTAKGIVDQASAAVQPAEFVPIPVGNAGGRVLWPAYVKAIGQSVTAIQPGDLPDWIEAQRVNVTAAPRPQMLLLVKALIGACAAAQIAPPEWVKGILGLNPAAELEAETPASGVDPGFDSPDRRIADGILKDLAATTGPSAATELGKNEAINRKMRALRASSPAIFDEVDRAFAARMNPEGTPQ